MLKADLILGTAIIAFLVVWAWFFTGPELRWEQQLYEAHSGSQ